MSRYQVEMALDTNEHKFKVTFAYGYDRPMQTYFWQVFDDEGETLVDEGGMTPRSGGELLEAIDKYGIEHLIKEDHMANAAMDLPF